LDAASAESKLAEISLQLGENHPQYQSAKAQVNKIKSQLQAEISRVANSISRSSNITEQREAELRVQVELQKQKVLELNRTRDESTLLKKDVEIAQRAMDTVTQRFGQTRIEGESNQSDIAILNPAIPQETPSSPKVFLNIVLAFVMGGILGIGFGFLAELFDRRIRCREDIVNTLNMPVLAIIVSKSKNKDINLLTKQTYQ
jgi:uncharacterized protein involved in exopolysaccharide biosynthesis